MKKGAKIILVVVLVLVALFGGFFLGQHYVSLNPLKRAISPMDKLQATLHLIKENYVDSVDVDDMVSQLIPTLIRQLDPHSVYLTAEERAAETESLDGYFYGVGITFNTVIDTPVVIQTIPNGPSDIAGLRAGDRIVTINGKDATGPAYSADSIRALLKGKAGSIVTLGISPYHSNTITDVQIKRGVVNTSTIDASFMVNDSLGFIRLGGFALTTHDDFMQAFSRLQSHGAKGIILDLRDNPGGLMQAALLIANEALPLKSMIIYTEGLHQDREEIYSDGTGSLINFPIYILLNEFSASSSEIVSGALQDNDAAIILGRRSFGKGLVQKPFEYYDGSSVHLTIARYHTSSGRSIQREYKLGNDQAYSHDWFDRIMGGEMFSQDSIRVDTMLLYKTKSGRPVYGGGGIMPDIFVPRDSAGINSYYAEVLNAGLIHEFAFVYADKFRNLLMRLENAEQVCRFLDNQGMIWQLANYAQQKGVRPRNFLIVQAHQQINNILYPLIIDYIFGKDESWKARSFNDPMVRKAEELFATGITSPLDLPKSKPELLDSLLLLNNE